MHWAQGTLFIRQPRPAVAVPHLVIFRSRLRTDIRRRPATATSSKSEFAAMAGRCSSIEADWRQHRQRLPPFLISSNKNGGLATMSENCPGMCLVTSLYTARPHSGGRDWRQKTGNFPDLSLFEQQRMGGAQNGRAVRRFPRRCQSVEVRRNWSGTVGWVRTTDLRIHNPAL